MDEQSICDLSSSSYFQKIKTFAEAEGSLALLSAPSSRRTSAELDDEEEKAMFREESGITESGLSQLIRASYNLLGLISFLTAGSDECRAWTIKKGTRAPQAAGKIHSDFERGFIRAEVVSFEDLKTVSTPGQRALPGPSALRGQGLRHAGWRRGQFPV